VKRTIWATLVALLAFAVLAVGGAGAAANQILAAHSSALAQERETLLQDHQLRRTIRVHRHWAWYWETKIHAAHTPTGYADRHPHSLSYLGYAARFWYRTHLRVKHEAVKILARRRQQVLGAAGHLAGWSCITNGAYPGAPHEGHGWNGPYSGPLQMTNPWMGYSAPHGDWNSIGDRAVYAIADRVAAQHGYSYSWMAGQWPNTYPPCANRF
jgi:hypothetical protein